MSTRTSRQALPGLTAGPRRAGLICLAGAVIGVLQAAVLLVVPAAVGPDLYSYPFDSTGYAIAQTTFFLQHLLLLVGLRALVRVRVLQASRLGRVAGWTALVGMALLAVLELVAISAAHESTTSDRAQLVNGLYALPVLLIAAGLLTTGVLAVRAARSAWAGAEWLPLLVLVTGAYVVVPLIPALAGPFEAGRLGIGGWMLLFTGLGYGLTRLREDA